MDTINTTNNDAAVNFLILGCQDIFNTIGPGYPECVYHRALEVYLRSSSIKYESEVITPITYMGLNIGHTRSDLIIDKSFIVELKAISNFTFETGVVQLKNYMKHHAISSGLIVNFGQPTKISCDGLLSFRMIKIENNNFEIYDYEKRGQPPEFSFIKRTVLNTLTIGGGHGGS